MSLKRTRQRAAIRDALQRAGAFRSAQQVHEAMNLHGESIGLATVYRNLSAMCTENEVDVLHPPGGEAIYRVCKSNDHHHHLVCKTCGTAVEVESPDVEDWATRTAKAHRFRGVVHTAELYGTCSSCS